MVQEQEPVMQLAVKMTCQGCAKSVEDAVAKLGVTAECNVDTNSVIVRGRAAPSAVVEAITATGKEAIVRGTGAPNSAAVCILEDGNGSPHGLVRLVQMDETMLDVSVASEIFKQLGPKPALTAREYGDISRGPLSTGKTTDELLEMQNPTAFGYTPVKVSSLIGRSLVLGPADSADSLVGIVARSAGAWELDKSVCSCTGRTLWEEPRLS